MSPIQSFRSPEDALIENSVAGLVMLPPGRGVTVTREQYHQAVLATYAPGNHGHRRSVAVELAVCRISSGKYAGSRGIEVRLDGRRIGELTHNMSQRYLPVVEQIIMRGGRPGCEATIHYGARGLEAELRLPAPREPRREAAAARPTPLGPPPNRPPTWPGPPPPPPALPLPARSSAGRFRLGWVGAGVVTLLFVVGALANDDPQPSIPPAAASEAEPSATPTTTATPSTRRTEAAPSTRPTRTPAPTGPKPTSSRSDDDCDPNYSGCVPVARDVDCEGGSGDGPAYVRGPVRVVGKDVYGLDRDGNGTGCER